MVPGGAKLMSLQNQVCAAIEEDEAFEKYLDDGEITECDIKILDHTRASRRKV